MQRFRQFLIALNHSVNFVHRVYGLRAALSLCSLYTIWWFFRWTSNRTIGGFLSMMSKERSPYSLWCRYLAGFLERQIFFVARPTFFFEQSFSLVRCKHIWKDIWFRQFLKCTTQRSGDKRAFSIALGSTEHSMTCLTFPVQSPLLEFQISLWPFLHRLENAVLCMSYIFGLRLFRSIQEVR